MTRKLWWKGVLLALSAGTTLGLGFGGCLDTTVQRVLVAVVFD